MKKWNKNNSFTTKRFLLGVQSCSDACYPQEGSKYSTKTRKWAVPGCRALTRSWVMRVLWWFSALTKGVVPTWKAERIPAYGMTFCWGTFGICSQHKLQISPTNRAPERVLHKILDLVQNLTKAAPSQCRMVLSNVSTHIFSHLHSNWKSAVIVTATLSTKTLRTGNCLTLFRLQPFPNIFAFLHFVRFSPAPTTESSGSFQDFICIFVKLFPKYLIIVACNCIQNPF